MNVQYQSYDIILDTNIKNDENSVCIYVICQVHLFQKYVLIVV